MKRGTWVLAALVTATLTSGAHEAAARNIFDDFSAAFSEPAPPTQYYYYDPEPDFEPLEMTVHKRRKLKQPKYPEVSSKPSPPIVNLDPVTDPSWFLKDPTLRRGDIVVTNKGVLVFNGRRNETLMRGDFASLGGKSGGSAWQRRLKAAAAGGRSYFSEEPAPVGNKEATAR